MVIETPNMRPLPHHKMIKTNLVEVSVGEYLAAMPPLDPSAVNQYANLVPVVQHPRHKLRHVLRHGQVCLVDDGSSA